ncbi:Ig-like domain-containing protein [Roseateles oligotrophus]|uniref:Ig-like domain-containing protein n=1 Tax=Roseateles oligotrophus TaxID=1769250 RepID=A0ABT2YEP0_9BURK|nr:Ig-like domain-containing protein [Roseateles oligotrophus]MCV2368520.1 Ig-like domain-containing protein [Roseateles oligotrophus]
MKSMQALQEYAEMSSKTNRFGRRCALVLLSLAMAGLLAACGGGGSDAGTPIFQDPATPVTPPAASTLTDLAVLGSVPSVPNSGAEKVTFTITALAAGNTAITGIEVPVSVTVDSGAIVTPSAKVTSKDTGSMTAVVQLVDRTSRTVKVTVTSGSVTKTSSFDVVDSVNGSKVADLRLVLDKSSIPNNGSESVKLTVTSLDANRNVTGGSPVSFAVLDVPADGAVVNASGKLTTDPVTGDLVADVSLGNDRTSRPIAIKVISGTVSRQVSFNVIDSVAVIPKASVLTLSMDKTTVGNSGSDTVNVVATAKDSANNALAGIKVTFSVDQNAVLVPGNLVTDALGQAKASVQIGADRSSRTVTVTTTSEALRQSKSFTVSGAKLQATPQPATLQAGEKGVVDYSLTDVNANPMPDVDAIVSPPSPAASQALKSDTQGKFRLSFTVPADTAPGPYSIRANAGGVAVITTVQIDSKIDVVPTGTNIASATFTASPLVVNVNPIGSSENRAELRLLFRGDNNLPIRNVRVLLSFAEDAAATDGDISSGKDRVITSDANGVAAASFIAGQRSSPTGQLKVYACYAKDDSLIYADPNAVPLKKQPWALEKSDPAYRAFASSDCKAPNVLKSVALTVVEQPVSISIGSNEAVLTGASRGTYMQEFVVLVVDSAGNPKAGVQLSPLVDLPSYRKGYYDYDALGKRWIRHETAVCLNEDSSVGVGYRNATIEAGEDVNGNGQLDPRKSDVSVSMVGSTKTDVNGVAILRVEYPQSMGSWGEIAVRVSASGVLSPPAWTGRLAVEGDTVGTLKGTERLLIVPIDVIKNEATPPFAISPYGQVGSCANPN